MIVLDLSGHAAKEIDRIKTAAEASPVTWEQMEAKAFAGDLSFPPHLTMVVPQGWNIGYIVEQQPEPFGLWRRLRVTIGLEALPPQEGIIKLMEAFGFENEPHECLWVPDQSAIEGVAAVCVMEPLEGRSKLLDFMRRMAVAEQVAEAQSGD